MSGIDEMNKINEISLKLFCPLNLFSNSEKTMECVRYRGVKERVRLWEIKG